MAGYENGDVAMDEEVEAAKGVKAEPMVSEEGVDGRRQDLVLPEGWQQQQPMNKVDPTRKPPPAKRQKLEENPYAGMTMRDTSQNVNELKAELERLKDLRRRVIELIELEDAAQFAYDKYQGGVRVNDCNTGVPILLEANKPSPQQDDRQSNTDSAAAAPPADQQPQDMSDT